jgi:hypothetical protein
VTRSVYVIGGTGTGKSTFTAQLISELGCEYGPLTDLHVLRNAKSLVTLRGHPLMRENGAQGLYLGVNRESFPGTDGLDRATSPTGEAWLQAGDLPDFIVSEGATLSTVRFLTALQDHTELLLVHLHLDLDTRAERLARRGTPMSLQFTKQSTTRAANRLADMQARGARTLSVDTGDSWACEFALDAAKIHLQKG